MHVRFHLPCGFLKNAPQFPPNLFMRVRTVPPFSGWDFGIAPRLWPPGRAIAVRTERGRETTANGPLRGAAIFGARHTKKTPQKKKKKRRATRNAACRLPRNSFFIKN